MRLLFKLLKQNVSISQILGFVVVNLIGGVIVLFGVQAYNDFSRLEESEDQLLSKSSIVISKSVSALNTAKGGARTFTDKEIEELKRFSSVSSVGEFKTSNFEVTAEFKLNSDNSFRSEMFLDAVPDEFVNNAYDAIDGNKYVWDAHVDSDTVPLILPRNYLNLYNFGYAASTGKPVVSEKLLAKFPITIIVNDRFGNEKRYTGIVCGLTNKLNTILVPWNFITEANQRYAPGEEKRPTRLIITTDAKEFDESIIDFIDEKGYIIEGDSSHVRLQNFIYGLLFVVIGIGFIFSLLAFFLLVISILLLIEKNKEKITNLYSMGYSIGRIAKTYQYMALSVDIFVWLAAAIIATGVYPMFSELMTNVSLDFVPTSLFVLWGVALLLATLFSSMHCYIVHNQVKKICKI